MLPRSAPAFENEHLKAAPMIYPVPSWRPAPATPRLGTNEVHVWRARLDLTASQVQNLQNNLVAEELRRAERYYFLKDHENFVVTRGLLRAILGCYLNMEPGQLQFSYSPHGKPALSKEFGGDTLRFNLSHSHGLALYAITRGREIGVDVERIRTDFASEQIAELFFSPREVVALRALPTNVQVESFFNCWTRKEAYVKARGEGLRLPLDQFEVSLAPGEPAALLSTNRDPQGTSRWLLHELAPGPGYVAALAVEGHGWQLKCWQWAGNLPGTQKIKHRFNKTKHPALQTAGGNNSTR